MHSYIEKHRPKKRKIMDHWKANRDIKPSISNRVMPNTDHTPRGIARDSESRPKLAGVTSSVVQLHQDSVARQLPHSNPASWQP